MTSRMGLSKNMKRELEIVSMPADLRSFIIKRSKELEQ